MKPRKTTAPSDSQRDSQDWKKRLRQQFPFRTTKYLEDFVGSLIKEQEKDFIVVKDYELVRDLASNPHPPKSFQGKQIIVAPKGLEFISVEELKRIPQIKQELDKSYQAGFQEAVKKLKELEVKKFPYGERPWCTECIRRIRKALKPTQSQGSEGEKRLTKKEKKIIGWKKYLKKERSVK